LCIFDCFFGVGIGGVKSEIEAEELDKAGDINDGKEDPSKHSLVEEKFAHLLIDSIKL